MQKKNPAKCVTEVKTQLSMIVMSCICACSTVRKDTAKQAVPCLPGIGMGALIKPASPEKCSGIVCCEAAVGEPAISV